MTGREGGEGGEGYTRSNTGLTQLAISNVQWIGGGGVVGGEERVVGRVGRVGGIGVVRIVRIVRVVGEAERSI